MESATEKCEECGVEWDIRYTRHDAPDCIEELQAKNAKLVETLRLIAEVPCCKEAKYPGCRACESIDAIAHAGLGKLVNDCTPGGSVAPKGEK